MDFDRDVGARSGAQQRLEMLDEAAQRIVTLAAPFPAVPTNEKVDELYITRTWQFLRGNELQTSG